MIKANTKESIKKKIIGMLIIFSIINIISMFFNYSNASTEININDEEKVSEAIKDLILTINSEGMNKTLMSQTLNLYNQITTQYTNNEIVDMIENNREYLEKNNVQMDTVNNVVALLKNINTQQLRKVLSQIDIDKISLDIENGKSAQEIIKDITGNMTTAEKVNFIMDIVLSAYVIKTILIILILLFVYRTFLRCVIYKKAHQKAWAPFIPIYRNVVMLKICGMSPWWLLLLLVPIVGWILLWIVSVASKFMLAESFNKGTGFAFGLWLLAPIFESILVFSKKVKYIGFKE